MKDEGPIVVKNLSTGPITLNVMSGGKLRPVEVEGRGFYEVAEGEKVANLGVLVGVDRVAIVLKLRSVRHLLKRC